MRQRPEITVVSRDRGSEYASAASAGAPLAVQIADRFHSCKNLTEATQLLLARGPGGNRGNGPKTRAISGRASQAPDQYPRVAIDQNRLMWRKFGRPVERDGRPAINK